MSLMLADRSRTRSISLRRCETACRGQDGDMCDTNDLRTTYGQASSGGFRRACVTRHIAFPAPLPLETPTIISKEQYHDLS
jgi:hypothetical protein